MRLATWFVAFLVGCTTTAPVEPQQATTAIATVGLPACTFTTATVDEIIDGIAANYDSERVRELLEAHSREHGWALDPAGPDYADSRTALRCPDEVLDHLRLPGPVVVDWNWYLVCEQFAVALERAGRLDRATRLIDDGISALAASTDLGVREVAAPHFRSRLRLLGAALCEREGSMERALAYASEWTSSSGCWNCATNDEGGNAAYRARLLVALHRNDEALPLLGGLSDSLGADDVATWIDCELGRGRTRNATVAFQRVCAAVPGGSSARVTCLEGKLLWDLRRSGPVAQAGKLWELSLLDPPLARSVALTMSAKEILELSIAFDVVDCRLRERALAEVLAYTGLPELQPAIERATAALGKEFDRIRARWERARARRSAVVARDG